MTTDYKDAPNAIDFNAAINQLPADVEATLKRADLTFLSIAGAKGSGKDTFADMAMQQLQKDIQWSKQGNLAEPLGYLIEYKWAEPLKAAASLLYGWSREDLEDYDFKETVCPRWNVKPRDILKDLSEEFLKMRDPYFLLKYAASYWAKNIQALGFACPIYIIISDTRFPDEVGFLRYFQLWNNHKLRSIRINRDEADTTDTHVSEMRLPEHLIDTEIHNDEDLAVLNLKAASVVRGLLHKLYSIRINREEASTLLNAKEVLNKKKVVTQHSQGAEFSEVVGASQTIASNKMSSLGELFPQEQERVREVLVEYEKIQAEDPFMNCQFAIAMIKKSLREADQAVISGDVVAMLAAYEDLKGITL